MRRTLREPIAVFLLCAACGSAEATNGISLGTAEAYAGTKFVKIPVKVTNDQSIHAYSIALSFDPANLVLGEITEEGSVIQAEFFSPVIYGETGRATIGVIFSYDSVPYSAKELPASPETPQQVATLSFDIAASAPPEELPIRLTDNVGSPPVSNRFSHGGTTIRPTFLQDGAIAVTNVNVMKIDTLNAEPGGRIEVKAHGKHPLTLKGYSIAFTYDKTVLTYVDATYLGTDVARELGTQTIELFMPQVESNFSDTLARFSLGAVVDYVPPFAGKEIPPSAERFHSLLRVTFDVANVPELLGTSTDLKFHNGGEGFVDNRYIIDNRSVPVAGTDGKITFTLSPHFRRGHVNADNSIDIADAIYTLGYLFLGTEAPICMSAADTNDDGGFDLSDVITILSYLFGGGSRPPDPFSECGPDPTPGGNLTCNGYPQCAE